jgi:hypothetical protein
MRSSSFLVAQRRDHRGTFVQERLLVTLADGEGGEFEYLGHWWSPLGRPVGSARSRYLARALGRIIGKACPCAVWRAG